MPKVLLVVGHPDLSRSKADATLVDAVRDLPHVTVHDPYATYPDFQIDVAAEQALLADHDVRETKPFGRRPVRSPASRTKRV
ncbi:NAD(P)H-dependent oxidoreductase [Streptomyces europaeiscabiei]|uniref:NAD(P)H-dependent oxidoreductase n=1 Tax=Streptomyces europaeiscabiei TaxID=146819 RepID=A0ABU4NQD5_9ACTN|nr:NAD(P)H-dependent oxidoreductase [Streptomyces europaeiscabiei]MDX3547688.1 NAD(P)H-dependent oxidoreductase [Streptomyces europaeiscabiei]MDX3557165.1 NAD(P)H-dependent oxidoreductase [Streptomyces europaeiscabiei]MDX3704872.1 NAD(P)H-dependent oxidoreductase [Streptomyces europaeiscabiei]